MGSGIAHADQQIDNFTDSYPAGDNYVAIGDSFTVSGYYHEIYSDPCLRNKYDYPHLVAQRVGLPLLEPACSGALTTQYWEQGIAWQTEVDKSPMRDSITRKTKLVTFGLGANNVDKDWDGETNTPELCIVYVLTHGWAKDHSVCEKQYGAPMRHWLGQLKGELVKMFNDAKSRAAKDAVLIAVGYIPLFPADNESCYDTFYIPRHERAWAYQIFHDINTIMGAAAKEAGIGFYNPEDDPLMASHGACGKPGERWVTVSGAPEMALLVHPTPAGHAHVAKEVSKLYWKLRR